jgi:hypothetical protein
MIAMPVRMIAIVTLLLAATWISQPLHAQNPIAAAREAFRKVQEEAKRKAQEEAQRRTGQLPAPAQASAPAPAPGNAAPNGGAATPGGTPETTASLAKAAQFVDVAGLKLGMPLQGVEAAIRALNPALKSNGPDIMVVWPYDESDTTQTAPANAPRSVQKIVYQAPTPRGASEVVDLLFALYTNPAVVTTIERQVRYEQGKGPTLETVVQGLRTKYGQDALVMNQSNSAVNRSIGLRWHYESGNQLRGNLAERARDCNSGGADAGTGTPCGELIVIDSSVTADGYGVVTHLSVRAGSYPLTRSAAGATDAYLRQVSEERAKRKRDESSQRSAPKL